MSKKILIVDDEPSIIVALQFLMEQNGYDTMVAFSGEEAMEAVARHRPDLILLDIMLPVVDGFEVCQRVRENPDWKDIRIVLRHRSGQRGQCDQRPRPRGRCLRHQAIRECRPRRQGQRAAGMPRLTKIHAYWWVVSGCALFFVAVAAGFAVVFWREMIPVEREFLSDLLRQHAGAFFCAGLVLVAGPGFAVGFVFRLYVLPIDRIAEETGIIHGVNSGHRIRAEGGADVARLAAAINMAADRYDELKRSVEERVAGSATRAEEENKILSVIHRRTARGGR